MHQLLQFAGPHMKPLSPFSKGSTTLGGKHLESALDRLNFFLHQFFPIYVVLLNLKQYSSLAGFLLLTGKFIIWMGMMMLRENLFA